MKTRSILILSILAAFSLTSCASMKKSSSNSNSQAAPSAAAAKPEQKAKPAAQAAGMVVCKHGKEERKLEVVSQVAGCELHYTKGGKAEVVATAVKGDDHCSSVSQRIQKKLAASGYQCQ